MAVTAPNDDGWRIPDELWERIVPLLPPRKPHPLGCHNPRVPDRAAMDAILFVLRTGCQWEALNQTQFCKKSSAHRRFQEWVEARVFERLWQLGLEEYDAIHGIEWRWQAMDGTMTKAPLGGGKNRTQSHRSGENGHETEPVDGWRRRAALGSGGRSQRQRLQTDGRDLGEDGRRATRPARIPVRG